MNTQYLSLRLLKLKEKLRFLTGNPEDGLLILQGFAGEECGELDGGNGVYHENGRHDKHVVPCQAVVTDNEDDTADKCGDKGRHYVLFLPQ